MSTVEELDRPEKDFAPRVRRIRTTDGQSTRAVPVTFISKIPHGDFAPRIKRVGAQPTGPLDPEWRERAVCKGKGNTPEGIAMWFPGPGGLQPGKHYCGVCPVTRECKKEAEDNGDEWGIWGGEIRHR